MSDRQRVAASLRDARALLARAAPLNAALENCELILLQTLIDTIERLEDRLECDPSFVTARAEPPPSVSHSA